MSNRQEATDVRYRTHRISDLNAKHVGTALKLSGRVSHIRDHGGISFIHLADGTGEIQIRFNPENFPNFELGREEWMTVGGTLEIRPEGTMNVLNPDIVLPAHELVATSAEVHARPTISLDKLPSLERYTARGKDDRTESRHDEQQGEGVASTVSEEFLLRYRPFSLRRNDLQRALRIRSRVAHHIRSFLQSEGFCEIETPILAAPTPEGARDFLVPSRVYRGSAYALPQSPQIYKQLLMIGGLDRYYQFSRCFRDEDLRANRQPEFTQVDLEMSFVTEDDIIELVTRMLTNLLESIKGATPTLSRPYRFSRMTHAEALASYGTDAPDLRIPYRLISLTEVFRQTAFDTFRKYVEMGGAILGIPIPASDRLGRNEIDRLRTWAKDHGLPQPAWGDRKDGEFISSIGKHFSGQEQGHLVSLMEEGGQIFFAAEATLSDARRVAGQLRPQIAVRSQVTDLERWEFVWITGFPAFERNAEGNLAPAHHPFTDLDLPENPSEDPWQLLETSSRAYDLALNGEELGSGSLRIHDLAKQLQVLKVLGYDEERSRRSFPHLLAGLEYGAPPHGGIALGFDRMISKLLGLDSIRQVIAFPKDGKGRCLMTGSPVRIESEDLRHLGLGIMVSEKDSGA
jgi:aspartyl-tRNA synthetase